jgi:hypothetical protein
MNHHHRIGMWSGGPMYVETGASSAYWTMVLVGLAIYYSRRRRSR